MHPCRLSSNLLRRCHECNYPIGDRDLFCPRCGAKQRREKLAITPRPVSGAGEAMLSEVVG